MRERFETSWKNEFANSIDEPSTASQAAFADSTAPKNATMHNTAASAAIKIRDGSMFFMAVASFSGPECERKPKPVVRLGCYFPAHANPIRAA
jgi:hypothetical protein